MADSHTMQDQKLPTAKLAGDPPSIAALETGTFEEDRLADVSFLSESLRHQANPCVQETSRLKQTLETIRRRRSLLAVERAEDTMKSPIFDDSQAEDRSKASEKSALIREMHSKTAKNFIANSVHESFVINPSAEACSKTRTELTTEIRRHILRANRAPVSYRPFVALHDNLHRLANPPCPRCGNPISSDSPDDQNGICTLCYQKIYLRSPFNTNRSDPADGTMTTRKERLKQQARITNEAADVMSNVVMGMKGSSSPASGSTLSSQDPQANFVEGGRGNEGDGDMGRNGQADQRTWEDGWNVSASDRSLRTINPIRNLVQNIQVVPNPSKTVIKLSIGDPSVYGNLVVSDEVLKAFSDVIWQRRANGYSLSMGSSEARAAVANRYSTSASPLTEDDVLLTGGTSAALEVSFSALVNEGDNVLLPRPGFPLFRTLAENLGVECRYYRLDADKEWDVVLEDISALADERTRAIVVNNPANPCGSVYSREHIEEILAVASSLRVPVLADEVYADMVFSEGAFTSFGAASVDVPVLCVGGISKQFVVPGWRLGWVLVHDRNGIFTRGDVRKGLRQLTTRMMPPNTPVQSILPMMLEKSPGFAQVMAELSENASFTMDQLKYVPGLRCIKPSGAMYVMVEVDADAMGFKDDVEFTEKLYEEEAVFVLPGQCFQLPNFVRIVFAAPKDILADAFGRIAQFCARHIK